MSSSVQSRRDGGFVVTLTLLFLAMIGMALLLAWQQRQAAAARRAERLLQIRLDRELAGEMKRLDAASFAADGRTPRQALLAQALANLLRRGRDERLNLEQRRRQLQRLLRSSAGNRRQEVRRALRRLDAAALTARRWVEALEAQLLAARRLRAPPSPASTPTDSLPDGAP